MTNHDTIEAELRSMRTNAPSGTTDAVLQHVGLIPSYDVLAGPTGPLWVVWGTDGVTDVVPAPDEATFLGIISGRVERLEAGSLPERLERKISQTLESGKLGTLPVDLSRLTEFQQSVLEATARIPAGQMRPYSWIAREIGKPGAVRAVGSALNKNPVPVLIPCHRVNRSDGLVGEYAYGPEMKRDLLRHEGLDPDALDDAAARGDRFSASDTTGIYCFPTCHGAKRLTDAHRLAFSSRAAAEAAGYRACKMCRPAVAS